MRPMTSAPRLPVARPPPAAPARKRSFVFIELCRALVKSGRWWLIPMVAVLAASALLLAVVAAVEYVAPFVYTIF